MEELTLDVLPLEEKVLGYTNIWYESALKGAHRITLPGGLAIKVITAPFFLGTKMEAFRGGARGTFSRTTIWKTSSLCLTAGAPYLKKSRMLRLQEPRFLEVLPGYVLGDEASQQRVPLILQRLTAIARLV
jgi:hypothetical protein